MKFHYLPLKDIIQNRIPESEVYLRELPSNEPELAYVSVPYRSDDDTAYFTDPFHIALYNSFIFPYVSNEIVEVFSDIPGKTIHL